MKVRSTKTKELVLDINKTKKTVKYFVSSKSRQYNIFKEILLNGFTQLPKGFYKEGFGLDVPAGTFLVNALKDNVNETFKFIISKDDKSAIKKIGKGYQVTLNYTDFLSIQDGLKDIRKEKNEKLRKYTEFELGKLLPKYFEKKAGAFEDAYTYSEDKISKIINTNTTLIDSLSKNDISAVGELYNKLLESNKIGQTTGDLKIIGKTKSKNEKIYLEKVIKQFEANLQKTLSESTWQQFLSEFILVFNTSYIGVLEKLSVSLGGKYPDFMLIDMYNYIDIYEIKKPGTNLLLHDDSRDNYFWDKEVSKAVSQTENYIHLLLKNSLTFKDEVKLKKKIDINVVRPRGYVIAGTSSQLTNDKMKNDFRLLAHSLKNINIILYDDLLNSLKNLYKRL